MADIVIHNDIDPITDLYGPNDEYIGKVNNNTVMTDILAQIYKKQLEGYYVMFNGEKLPITKTGRIYNPPEGFYDALDIAMRELVGF